MDCFPWLAKLYPARAPQDAGARARARARAQAQAQAQATLEARIADEMEAQLEEIRAEPIFCCEPTTSDMSSMSSMSSDASCASGQLYWEQLRGETF